MVSIIIPAHNEADVIDRCLATLLADNTIHDNGMEVIVVCNACTDDTAERARRYGPALRVLETDVPGKPNALNMGDGAARYFPRVYVDADVLISGASVQKVVAVLNDVQSDVRAASPRAKVNLEGRNWLVRAYYQIWTRLPYFREEMVGSGVYALSERGRAAFGDFPELLAEDDFIRLTFPKGQRRRVGDATFEIESPTTFRALMKIRCRWARSNDQIDAQYPELRENDERDYGTSLRELARQPVLWPAMAVYAAVVLSARMMGKLQIRFAANPWTWSRDLTARRHAGQQGQVGAPAASAGADSAAAGSVESSATVGAPRSEPVRTRS